MSKIIRSTRGQSLKEPASRKASGMAHRLSALHQNAAAVVNAKSQLNGPDQVRTNNFRIFEPEINYGKLLPKDIFEFSGTN